MGAVVEGVTVVWKHGGRPEVWGFEEAALVGVDAVWQFFLHLQKYVVLIMVYITVHHCLFL